VRVRPVEIAPSNPDPLESATAPNLALRTSWQNGSLSQKAIVRNPAHPEARENPPVECQRTNRYGSICRLAFCTSFPLQPEVGGCVVHSVEKGMAGRAENPNLLRPLGIG